MIKSVIDLTTVKPKVLPQKNPNKVFRASNLNLKTKRKENNKIGKNLHKVNKIQ